MKDYVKPKKEKKKVNEDDDVLMNNDGFWDQIPDELKPSKYCRIFIKQKNIDDLSLKQVTKTIQKQEDRLEQIDSTRK